LDFCIVCPIFLRAELNQLRDPTSHTEALKHSMDDEWDPHALLVCPYDEVHVVSVLRFQRHLLKCRKNHPDKDLVKCPYNATHILLRDKLRSHLSVCPDKRAIDPDIIQAQNSETGEIARQMGNVELPERTWIPPAESEDWDLEALGYEKEDSSKSKGDPGGSSVKHGEKRNKNPFAKEQYNDSLAAREEQSDLDNEHFSTYVRMAGRGFNLNRKDIGGKVGVGRGTVYNRK